MQKQNDLANNLMNLFKESSYKEFGEGYFVNQPKMAGYFYIFKKITDPKFCVIVNVSGVKYPSNMARIKDYVFIIFNVESFDEYKTNFTEKYFPTLLNLVDQNLQKKNERNLPYGYYIDENGDLKIDIRKANEVRRIYDRYIDTESVRTIADEMKSNFSHIRDVLHANEEYMQMQHKIIPIAKLKRVNELLAKNVKGTFKKTSTRDEIEEIRRRRKEKERMQKLQ